jgi:hypothetical protein
MGQGLGEGYSLGYWGPGQKQQNQNFGPDMEQLEEEEYDRGEEEEEELDEDLEDMAAQNHRVSRGGGKGRGRTTVKYGGLRPGSFCMYLLVPCFQTHVQVWHYVNQSSAQKS